MNWWVNGIKPDGTREWPGAQPRTFVASGFNENKCFVIPEWNMVIVRMGTRGSPQYPEKPDLVWGKFISLVGEAVVRP